MEQSAEIKSEKRKQRERIRTFDKELFSCLSNRLPHLWLERMCGFLAVFLMALPWQMIWQEESFGMLGPVFTCSVLDSNSYLASYMNLRENGKRVSVYQKMRYLPVDIRQIQLVRIGYLIHFLKKTGLVALLLQLGSALLFYRTVSAWNVIYVLIFALVLPFIVSAASIASNIK